jgi:hypothetical protein
MKIRTDIAQGSLEWMTARAGIPTASEFHNLVTPAFAIRTGETPRSYLKMKLAERWLSSPLGDYRNWDMEIGAMLEGKAKPFFSMLTNLEVTNVGLCLTDDGRVGCSPDGLIGDHAGIEIKCPAQHTHVGYLLEGKVVPDQYLAQVHGSMYVTGRAEWYFMSFSQRFPQLVVHVQRDEKIIAAIDDALTLFLDRLDRGYEHLCELNGGPPRRYTFERPKQQQDPDWMEGRPDVPTP